jgi:hypothetical protein
MKVSPRVSARRALVAAVAVAASWATLGVTSADLAPTAAAVVCSRTVPAGGSIQSVINAAPNGSTICLTAGATYRLTSAVKIVTRQNFTLDGRGATLKAATYWGYPSEIVFLRGGSKITVRNLRIYGSHTSPGSRVAGNEFQAGVGVFSVQGALVDNVHVRNNRGDGFGVYGYGDTPSRDVIIRNGSVSGNGRQGVTVTHAQRVTIARNRFWNIAWMVLDVEPDPRTTPHSVSTLYFRNNVMSGRIQGQMAAIGGYGPSSNIYIDSNYVKAGQNYGIWSFSEPRNGFRNKNVVFRNNIGEQTFWADPGWRGVVLLCDTDGASVTGNRQPTTSGKMPGVSINASTGVSVASNVFSGTFAATQWNAYACP